MRGKTSVPSDIAISAHLIWICAEFVGPLIQRFVSEELRQRFVSWRPNVDVVGYMNRQCDRTVLRLDERGEDDDVREVVASTRIEYATACHQLQRRIVARTVDEGVGEVRLLVHTLADDREYQVASVGQRH